MFMIHHVLELRGVDESKGSRILRSNSGMRAARGLWFLEYYGHPNAKMLDGGFRALESGWCAGYVGCKPPKTAPFKIAERRDVLATTDDVLRSLDQKQIAILDTAQRKANTAALTCAPRAAARFPARSISSGPNNIAPDGNSNPTPISRRSTKKPASRQTKKWCLIARAAIAAAHSYVALRLLGFRKSAITSAPERVGRTAPICRSKFPSRLMIYRERFISFRC